MFTGHIQFGSTLVVGYLLQGRGTSMSQLPVHPSPRRERGRKSGGTTTPGVTSAGRVVDTTTDTGPYLVPSLVDPRSFTNPPSGKVGRESRTLPRVSGEGLEGGAGPTVRRQDRISERGGSR